MSPSTQKVTLITRDGERVEFPVLSKEAWARAKETVRVIDELLADLKRHPSRLWDIFLIRKTLRDWAIACAYLAEGHGIDVNTDPQLKQWQESTPGELNRLLFMVEGERWTATTKNWKVPASTDSMARELIAMGQFSEVCCEH